MKRVIFFLAFLFILTLTACSDQEDTSVGGPVSRVQVEDSGFDLSTVIEPINAGDTVTELDENFLEYMDNYRHLFDSYEVSFSASIAKTKSSVEVPTADLIQIVIQVYTDYADYFNTTVYANLELMFLQIRQDIESDIQYDTALTMFVRNDEGKERYRFRFEYSYDTVIDILEREITLITDISYRESIISDFIDHYILDEDHHFDMSRMFLTYDELTFTTIVIYPKQKVFSLYGDGTYGNNTSIDVLVQNKLPDFTEQD